MSFSNIANLLISASKTMSSLVPKINFSHTQKKINKKKSNQIWIFNKLFLIFVTLAPPNLLFNVGCKFALSFLATTAWHSFSKLAQTLNQGE